MACGTAGSYGRGTRAWRFEACSLQLEALGVRDSKMKGEEQHTIPSGHTGAVMEEILQ